MSKLTNVLRKAGLSSLRRASGFTLVSQVVSVFVGSMVLLGGWAAYRDLSMQWKVANAERQMDQYANNAMGEIINTLQWSMGAYPIASGRNPRWRIAIGEFIGENGGLNSNVVSQGHFPYQNDGYFTLTQAAYQHRMFGGFITLQHTASRGILINGQEPYWAGGDADQFIWRGQNPRDEQREFSAFDRRDRMTVSSLSIDFPLATDPAAPNEGAGATALKSAAIRVKLVMQYRYRASDWIGIYGDDYIRERSYETSISPLNHGHSIEDNPYFDEFVQTNVIGL